jgi:hypothetical protein
VTDETNTELEDEQPVPAAEDQQVTPPESADDAPQPGQDGGEKPSLSEAIDAAISGAGPKKVTPKAELTPEEKQAEIDAAAEKTAAEDAEAAEKGQVRGADGRFREMTPEEKKAHEEKKAAAAAKEADPVNDPIPKDLKEATAKRMQALIDTVKAQTALVEQHNALFGMIQGTGASPDEFAAMVTYMKAAHTSSDPKSLDAAYNLLKGELRGLCIRMGKPIPEVNLLRERGNEDLIQEVRDGKITVNRAHELAVARAVAAAGSTAAVQTRTAQEQKDADTRASEEGKSALDALDGELRKRDGDAVFNAKYDILVPILADLFKQLDPKHWKGVFLNHYEKLKISAAATPKPPAPGGAPPANRPQPLRPKPPAGSGGVQSGPKTAREAIDQALDGM